MTEFFCWIFLYIALHTIISACASPLMTAVVTILYTACLLWLFCRKAPYRELIAFHKDGLVMAIPLFIFAMANFVFLRDFSVSAVLVTVTVGAAAEELLFRGLMFSALNKKSQHAAIWGSTVLFFAYHLLGGDILGAFCALCFGFALAVYVARFGSVLPCIAAHMLTNMLSIGYVPWQFLLLCSAICIIYGCILYPKKAY